jgi:glycosyltransferase involved in cell wall biosynthesis
MNIAIVQDEIVRRGGAEQVVLSFHNAFPDAPIYTLNYNPETSYPEFKLCNIKTSWFGKYIKSEKNLKRFFFPFGILAMKQLYLKGFDVILQSTTHCAKYIKTDPNTIVITYCHTPFRLVWNPDSYEAISNGGSLKRKLFNLVINRLKVFDKRSALRTDYFITNSRTVVPRIEEAYQPPMGVTVINPSVKCDNFYVADTVGDYYLVVSRFEYYKKVDLVIETFNLMPDKKLIVVGKGSREKELKELAGENVTFLSGQSAKELADLYANCKAFIFPQLEDYGITPLEANASGRPVIAYGKGGVLDTMIPLKDDASKATAVLFPKQTTAALKHAIETFEVSNFDPSFIRQHAETFDDTCFVKKIRDFVGEKYLSHQNKPLIINEI